MRSRTSERGNALLVAVISVMVMAVAAVGVVRYASREVAGATAGRKEASIAACADAARAVLMSRWKLVGGLPAQIDVTLEGNTPTQILGGHYGQDAGGLQKIKLNPLTVGSVAQVNDLTNKIVDDVENFRVLVHCKQGRGSAARELELEYAVNFGM